MTRLEKVEVSAVKAMSEGYEFLGKGMGTQDEALEAKRAEGYDVRAWYTYKSGDKSTWQWIMYGKMKKQRRSSKKVETPKIEYNKLTSKELKKLCSEKKIKGYGKMKKDEMIASLQSAC